LDAGIFARGKELLEQVYPGSYSELEESYSQVGIDVPEWARERQRMSQELLELLESGNREEIRRRLEEYKRYTRAALGIE
jgi:hypothetical protein